jgi:hypothetical protein
MMKIKALKAFTVRDSETGELMSIAHGAVAEVSSTLGNDLIADGLAEAYTLVNPTGTKTITENGEGIDVAQYATADVNVAGGGSSDFGIATVTFEDVSDAGSYAIVPLSVSAESGFVIEQNDVQKDHPLIVQMPLYKGKYVCSPSEIFVMNTLDASYMPTASGNIVFDLQSNHITITGDGTITAKGNTSN